MKTTLLFALTPLLLISVQILADTAAVQNKDPQALALAQSRQGLVQTINYIRRASWLQTTANTAPSSQGVDKEKTGSKSTADNATGKHAPVSLLSNEQRADAINSWQVFNEYITARELTAERYKALLQANLLNRNNFNAYRAIFISNYRFSLELIDLIESSPSLAILLNEEQKQLGIPADSYRDFKKFYLNPVIASRFAGLEVLSKTSMKIDSDSDKRRANNNIKNDSRIIWQYAKRRGLQLTVKNTQSLISTSASRLLFPVQVDVAQWAGNVRVKRKGQPLISPQQIKEMPNTLEPGDILLERREWYLTNVGIPGYWPHAALYIGTADQREKFFNDAEVQLWLQSQGVNSDSFENLLKSRYPNSYQLSQGKDQGHPIRVIEAIAEGVVFTSLEHSAAADSMAALRPRLSKIEKAKALLNAFSYQGRPYDYNFDFVTDNSLVCSELIYKAYQPSATQLGLQLPLKSMAGRLLMPANLIAQLYSEQFGTAQQQMDLVWFLDGNEYDKQATLASTETFKQSWTRKKWHILKKPK